jgi:inorganic triphosphatase YgiF
MKARIEQLEAELKARTATPNATMNAALAPVVPAKAASLSLTAPALALAAHSSSDSATTTPAKKEKIAPFSDWDWTWLNGNPRNKDTAFDSKFSPLKSAPT